MSAFTIDLDPAPALPGRIVPLALDGVEAMCLPSRFLLVLGLPEWKSSAVADLTGVLQKPVGLRLKRDSDEVLTRSLVVTQVEYLGARSEGDARVRLTLEDPLALAGVGRRTRAWTAKTIADIAKTIATAAETTANISDGSLQAPRIVQWQETDLAFLTRLLVRHGRFFYTRIGPVARDQRLVVGGSPSAYGPAGQALHAEFRSEGETGAQEGVYGFGVRQGLVPRSFTARAHDSRTVAAAETTGRISVPAQAQAPGDDVDNDVAVLPGRIAEAKRLGTAISGTQMAYDGRSTYGSLHAGRCMKLNVEGISGVPSQFLVIRVVHRWRDDSEGDGEPYVNDFVAVPYDQEWLPWPVPAGPRIDGVRLAKVIANDVPAGDASPEGTSLDQGVYWIEYPAERDWRGEPLTQYARLANPAAGNGRGIHSPPEVGDEVVVSFQHGDPDRPVIMGVLYNGSLAGPMVAVADGMTTSAVWRSHTGHELRFDDASGKERIHLVTGTLDHSLQMHDADKKVHLATKGNLIEDVALDHTTTVDGNQTVVVKGDQGDTVEGARSVSVTKDQTTTIDGSRSLSVGGDESIGIDGASQTKIGKSQSLTVDGSQTITVAKATKASYDDTLTVSVAKDHSLSISGASTVAVTKDSTTTVSGAAKLDVTKGLLVSAKTVGIKAADELSLVCGSAKIVLKKNGDITIQGGKITIKGSGDVTVKGSKVGIN
jgi:type VI secretion system secreted protein VgrG